VDGQGQPADAFLRIAHLTKRFGQFTALSDVSLDIHEGEFVCFLGPSGCGKTTLLRAIAGLDIQTSGSVVQAGADISALPPAERDFGIVFQSYALFPNMTVSSNVAYGLQSRRQSRAEIAARVAELLALVGMPEQGDKYPAQLSGGQQQRVALARAIATSPGLLLLDEPLSALDARVRVYLRREVRDLQRRLGVTTVMVTHDQEEALTMADRIVVMNEGKIEQVGTPIEVYREPATSFVAAFIGTMNFRCRRGARTGAGGARWDYVPVPDRGLCAGPVGDRRGATRGHPGRRTRRRTTAGVGGTGGRDRVHGFIRARGAGSDRCRGAATDRRSVGEPGAWHGDCGRRHPGDGRAAGRDPAVSGNGRWRLRRAP